MDTRAHYRRLFAYEAWANREVLTSLARVTEVPPKALGRFAHLLSAQRLWLERALGVPQTTPVWPTPELQRCAEELNALGKEWQAFVERLDDAKLDAAVRYVNTKGEPWQSRLGDVLDHLIAHSAYHRGQIASDLRSAGLVPAYTDLIHATRNGLV
ncbi:MAG: DinB family protein [Planctomycetes bacterium]|nr:DinB family protein [Planctomycetota bacterium]